MTSRVTKKATDVVIVGSGHNGLVAASILGRKGLSVRVLERRHIIGGAAVTEYPFKKAPQMKFSTGSYLLGIMQPELLNKLQIRLPYVVRDPHYFLPSTGKNYLLFSHSRPEEMRQQFLNQFSQEDWMANQQLINEISKIRDDIAPAWLSQPLSVEETAERYIRPHLRQAFIDLVRRPIADYINRFGFKSDRLKAMYAVTDGFSGVDGTWDTPGTGFNFLVHNMCRLPDANGTFTVVEGGMGTVTQALAKCAREAGVQIDTNSPVQKILVENGKTQGVVLEDGTEIKAQVVMANCDPFRMRKLVGEHHFPAEYNKKLDSMKREGTTFKLNMCLRGLPKFKCLSEDRGQYGTTTHILPETNDILGYLVQSYKEAKAGKIPDFPTIEWYIHTGVDASMRDPAGHHNSGLFIQWVPNKPKNSTWDREMDGFVKRLLDILDMYAPGTSSLVEEYMPMGPQEIENYFGITHGHIHHIDNGMSFLDRVPYRQPGVEGLYSASAGTHPAGSVDGSCGHNAAQAVLKDLNLPPF